MTIQDVYSPLSQIYMMDHLKSFVQVGNNSEAKDNLHILAELHQAVALPDESRGYESRHSPY